LLLWLLGRSGLDVLSSSSSHAASAGLELDELCRGLDEVILVVGRQSLGLACPPRLRPAFERLTRRLAAESQLHIYARPLDPFGQTDEDELFKIHAFIALTKPFRRVVVPVLRGRAADGAQPQQQQQQLKWDEEVKDDVERWPIVQAYGLDELGANGFFTLSHQMSAFNLSSFAPLADVDAAHVLSLLSERLPAMERQVHASVGRLLGQAALAVGEPSVRELTVGQAGADLAAFVGCGLEALVDDQVRARRSQAHQVVPSGLFFGPASSFAATSKAASDDALVRSAGLKHYSSLPSYYSRLLSAQPYLPLDPLLPVLSPFARAPLHALLRLVDPSSGLGLVRTVLLRQTTAVQDNEIECLEHLVPLSWRKKKRRIVKDGDEDEGNKARNTVGVDSDSGDDEDEDEEESSSSSSSSEDENSGSDEERKEHQQKKTKAPKPAKPAPERLKKEAPGLKDAMLLQHLYAILVQIVGEVLRDIVTTQSADANAVPSSSSAAAASSSAASVPRGGAGPAFPSFASIRDRVATAVEHLTRAKWLLPRFRQLLCAQTRATGPCVDEVASSSSGILGMELVRIDAFGERHACDISVATPLQGASPSARCLYSFSLYLHAIPSLEIVSLTEEGDTSLGSVGFGETLVWDGAAAAAATSAAGNAGRDVDEHDEDEKRRKNDPLYFGTGLTSSSALDAPAGASSSASSSSSSPSSSALLVLTASVPALLTIPSFFQAFELRALQALLSSYAHASVSSSNSGKEMSAAEVAAAGLVPLHPSLGPLLLEASQPRLPPSVLARPPTSALVGAGARMTLTPEACGVAGGFVPAIVLPQRSENLTRPLAFWTSDAWLCGSALASAHASLLLSNNLVPVLTGQLALFERGFVLHGDSRGSVLIDFQKHVLEAAYFDGDADGWDAAATDSTDDAGDDDDDDDAAGDDDDEEESDPTRGDALFILDLLAPASAAEAASTPDTLLRSLASPSLASLSSLAPLGNEGVAPPVSKFAKAAYSVALVIPRDSPLARAWRGMAGVQGASSVGAGIRARWDAALEALNIHNDMSDEVPSFCREVYVQLQEQHAQQRREARRSKRLAAFAAAENAAAATGSKAAAPKKPPANPESKHDGDGDDEDDDESEDDDDSEEEDENASRVRPIVLPDATCDFLQRYRTHEQRMWSSSGSRAATRPAASAGPAAASSTVPLTLVLGTPGAGHSALLQCLREQQQQSSSSSSASERWSIGTLGGGDEVFALDSARTQQALQSLVAEHQQSSMEEQQSNRKRPLRALLLVSSYASVVSVVDLLQSQLSSPSSSSLPTGLALSTVVVLQSCQSFFVGPSFSLTYPGVVSQLVPGFVQACLLSTPPQPWSAREERLVAAVRARMRGLLLGSSTTSAVDLRVVAANARIKYADVRDMLISDTQFARSSNQRKRIARSLLSSSSTPIPRSLSAGGVVHFFHLRPSDFLLSRDNFLRALVRFAARRTVYHSDEEKQEEDNHAIIKLTRMEQTLQQQQQHAAASSSSSTASARPGSSSGGGAGRSSAVPSVPSGGGVGGGRIVFTTSSSSLPSPYTVFVASALVKFEDAASNSGRCGADFLALQAAQGGLTARNVNFATNNSSRSTRPGSAASSTSSSAAAAPSGTNAGSDSDENERKESDHLASTASAASAAVSEGAPIPLSSLPFDIAQYIAAHPDAIPSEAATAAPAASSSSAVAAPPLSTASTSCLLLVYGSAGLSRDDVRRELLLPSVRNLRAYEKADSRWNAEVQRQREAILAV
jgi:hypothetical protein